MTQRSTVLSRLGGETKAEEATSGGRQHCVANGTGVTNSSGSRSWHASRCPTCAREQWSAQMLLLPATCCRCKVKANCAVRSASERASSFIEVECAKPLFATLTAALLSHSSRTRRADISGPQVDTASATAHSSAYAEDKWPLSLLFSRSSCRNAVLSHE